MDIQIIKKSLTPTPPPPSCHGVAIKKIKEHMPESTPGIHVLCPIQDTIRADALQSAAMEGVSRICDRDRDEGRGFMSTVIYIFSILRTIAQA